MCLLFISRPLGAGAHKGRLCHCYESIALNSDLSVSYSHATVGRGHALAGHLRFCTCYRPVSLRGGAECADVAISGNCKFVACYVFNVDQLVKLACVASGGPMSCVDKKWGKEATRGRRCTEPIVSCFLSLLLSSVPKPPSPETPSRHAGASRYYAVVGF